MRISEILVENATTEDDFSSDLEDILYAAHANGISDISTKSIAKQMSKMGYQTSLSHVMDVANTIPIVGAASVSKISLGADVVGDMAHDTDQQDEKESEVTDMAHSRVMDNIKD